jgi:hypothetical protein
VIFGAMFLNFENIIAKLGAATVVLGCIYIIYRLNRARKDPKESLLDDSVRDFCQQEIERLNRQVHLLRSVLWWYIAPIMLGVNLITFGLRGTTPFSIGYLAATLILSWGIYELNQRAASKHLMPVIEELDGLLKELGEE